MRKFGLIAAFVLSFAGVARADLLIIVSKANQEMTVAINGAPTYRWDVSTGKPGNDTPAGSYRAIRLERVYFSKKFDDAPMPNSVFFYGGYAIHGTYEVSKLGRPVSHGCVRLHRANAETLFDLVRVHGMSATRIVVRDEPLGGAMARSYDRPQRPVERSFAARRSTDRYEYRSADGRGFDRFGAYDGPRYVEPSRRVYWNDEPVRRGYRDNGWR